MERNLGFWYYLDIKNKEAAIYEFRPEIEDASGSVQNTNSIDKYFIKARQTIRRVKPEELRRFK